MENSISNSINFISSIHNDKQCAMHSKSGVEKIMTNDKAVKVIKLFKSLLNGYQNNLEKLMKGLEFVYDYVHLLYYKYHKLNLDHGG